MQKQKNRIMLDTNLWISFLLTKNFQNFDTIAANNLVTILFSDELLTELIEVRKGNKFRKYFELTDLDECF